MAQLTEHFNRGLFDTCTLLMHHTGCVNQSEVSAFHAGNVNQSEVSVVPAG